MRQMEEVIRDREQIAALVQEPVGELDGVRHIVLWEEDGSYAGLLWLEAGATMPAHVHDDYVHHVWVVEGIVGAFGRELPAGSYWFVPPEREHGVEGRPPDGCTLFFVYLRQTD
jgi:quercetin dioxygenase-like cupin family protein